MDEWQPVRVAPFDNRAHAKITISNEHLFERRKEMAGKIIRVRPVPGTGNYTCGTSRMFLTHPDDYGASVCLCEHHILAD